MKSFQAVDLSDRLRRGEIRLVPFNSRCSFTPLGQFADI